MTLTIYAFPPSPRNFKVLACAQHLGLPHEVRIVDLTKGEQNAEAFAAINPNCKAPALTDGDVSLWESNAMLLHLAEKAGALIPRDAAGRSAMRQWMFWDSTTWDPACATLVFEHVVKGIFGMGPPDPLTVEKGLAVFHKAAAILDGALKGRAFLCGEELSAADFAIGSALTMAEPAHYPLSPYAEIRRWSAQLEALPAWRAARALQNPASAAA